MAAAEPRPSARPRRLGQALGCAAALALTGCSYDVVLGSVTTVQLVALQCGTWDSAGDHTTDDLFVGHSAARPNDTVSYFVFNLSAVQGKTVTGATLTIPGTSDWKVTVPEPGTAGLLAFKLGATPLPASVTLDEVTTGTADPGVYQDVMAEQDLGFAWVLSGSTNNSYDAFHYDGGRLQRAVDAGGMFALFAVDRYGGTATTDDYLYGGGTCGPTTVLTLETE